MTAHGRVHGEGPQQTLGKGMKRSAFALAAALIVAGAASAHHGINAFDHNRDVRLEGVVAGIDFVNPHSWLYVDVTGADGSVTHHRCELRAATVLRRSGWSPEMFPVGSPITVTGSAHRTDPASCYLGTAIFADGSSIDRYGQRVEAAEVVAAAAQGRPARTARGEPNVFGEWAPEQVVMTDPRGQSGALVPVSRRNEFAPGETPEGVQPLQGSRGGGSDTAATQRAGAAVSAPWATRGVELTEAGQTAADAFETYSPEYNPRMRCETTSIIFDWTFDGPINRITRSDDSIALEYGQLGLIRTVHMDMDAHPADLAPSRAGHSIGRWEDDVLVVDTAGFAPGVLSPPVLHSEGLHVVERFTLDPATMTLTRAYEATDPVYFIGTYTGSDSLYVADLPFAPDPCEDLTFVDFSEEAGGRE
jgi:hypothetical protein